jgi:hypothetical protein
MSLFNFSSRPLFFSSSNCCLQWSLCFRNCAMQSFCFADHPLTYSKSLSLSTKVWRAPSRGGANPLRVGGGGGGGGGRVIFCRLLFGNFAESLADSKCACLNALYYPLLSRLSIRRNFARGAEFFFVLWFPGWNWLEKTKKTSAPRAKFRLVVSFRAKRPFSFVGIHLAALENRQNWGRQKRADLNLT